MTTDSYRALRLSHPEIYQFDLDEYNGGACPEQYSGWFRDDRYFYFRYRSGWASLRIWTPNQNPEEDFWGPDGSAELKVGDQYDGRFDTAGELNDVFTELYDMAISVG